jgi:serine/threonine-protein kinase
VERAKEILKQIVDAVAAAHEKGIVHGDLKPENVLFLEPDRMRVKLTDFDFGAGSADLLRRSVLLSTEFGDSGPGVGGTAYYISPEVNAGAEPTKASDVFAIGVMLNEMLTGSPFPIVIPVQNAGAALSSLVAKSVDRDPTRRPPDAAALLEEIGRAEAPPPKKRPAAGAGPVQAPVPPPAWVPPEERAKPKAPSKPPPKNKPGAIVAGIFGCTVLAALAALVAYGGYKVFTHYDKILGFFRNAIQAIFRGEPKYVFGAIVVVAIIARIAKKQK